MLKIKITGRVQGVGFRAATQNEAQRLGIKGFVQNQPDGSVYLEAAGPAEALERLSQWCQHGPPAAQVDRVQVEEAEAEPGFEDFDVRR